MTQNQTDPTPGVPALAEILEGQTVNAVIDPDLDILNNEFSGDEPSESAPSVTGASTQATSPDATAQAMLRVAESMERIVSRNESTRQLSYAEIKKVTAGNPTGDPNHPTFRRPTFMHGIQLSALQLTKDQVNMFNQLKPGRYIDRKVEVQLTNNGDLNLQWSGNKADQRIEMYTRFPVIDVMLKEIIAERAQKEANRRAGRFDDEEDVY